jgi:diketogulonate reductase-like aldo/keto reductase
LYQQDVTGHVSQAINAGFKHIDTAQAYGNEQHVGKALAAHLAASNTTRDSLFITTKFSNLLSGQSVRSVLEDQLRELRVDHVDLYLIHWPIPFEGRLGELWKEVEELKREGLAKEIGISNFRVEDLDEMLPTITKRKDGILPSVHQIEFHPYVLDTALPIMEVGKEHGIQTASYGG